MIFQTHITFFLSIFNGYSDKCVVKTMNVYFICNYSQNNNVCDKGIDLDNNVQKKSISQIEFYGVMSLIASLQWLGGHTKNS
jgi:hypothetical protein